MFSQLKNFLSKTLTRRPSAPSAPGKTAAAPHPAPVPETKSSSGTAFKGKSRPAPAAAAPAATSAPVAVATMPEATSAAPVSADDVLLLPLKVILNRLPAALAALVKSPGENGNIAVPMQRVLKLLPQGAVKVTFGELRQISPPGTFLEVATQDQTLVELPLPEIISRLSPAHLQRRTPQKQLEAPAEVGNLFGPRGEPLPQPAGETSMFRRTGGTTITAKTAVPPAPAMPAPASTAPSLPKPSFPAPPPPAPAPSAPRMPAPSLPKPFSPAPKMEAPRIQMPSAPPPAPAPAVAAAPGPEQTRYFLEKEAAPTSEVLTVALASISEVWPETIKKEIAEQKLGDSSVGLPMDRIEAALKTGKIVFTWGDIGTWVRPNPVSGSANAATVLDLPLKVVAPLFISQHRPVTQKKLSIADNIPDLFSGTAMGKAAAAPAQSAPAAPAPMAPAAPLAPPPPAPKPATTGGSASIAPTGLPKLPSMAVPPAAPPPPAPALPKPPAPPSMPPTAPSLPRVAPPSVSPISMPKPPAAPAAPALPKPPKPAPIPAMPGALPAAPAPAVAAPAAKEPQTLGELFGEADKKEWSPKEIVQKTNLLKGVAGSMISLPDGLMVAGELPAPFRAETTAAFLPQIFGRMNQYCKELHLGDMNGITVECQKAPLQIIRTGMVFLGVLGKPGEQLPASQIRLIAEELARQNK